MQQYFPGLFIIIPKYSYLRLLRSHLLEVASILAKGEQKKARKTPCLVSLFYMKSIFLPNADRTLYQSPAPTTSVRRGNLRQAEWHVYTADSQC